MADAALRDFLRREADAKGLVSLMACRRAADRFSLSFPEVEEFLLENGFFPRRYERQRELFRAEGQLRLLRARVAVIGCGGLGGALFEILVRLGVGRILAVDPDICSESNLNRQVLVTLENLGRAKVEAAAERAAKLNPAVRVGTVALPFQDPAVEPHLAACNLVFDALDMISGRLTLARLCRRLGLFLVHGAVEGWYGQVASVPASREILERIYAVAADGPASRSMAAAVNAIAALQAARGLRFLLGEDFASTGTFLDLSGPELENWE